jgi:hypothetical protein
MKSSPAIFATAIIACSVVEARATDAPSAPPARAVKSSPEPRLAGEAAARLKLIHEKRAILREEVRLEMSEAHAELHTHVVPVVRREFQESLEDAKIQSKEQARKFADESKQTLHIARNRTEL